MSQTTTVGPDPTADGAPAGRFPSSAAAIPARQRRTGWVLSSLAVLFLTFDATVKLLKLPVAVQSTVELGYPEGVIVGLGLIEAVCLAVYLVPRTSVFGAILWTGYLGGAIATHVRVGSPLFSHTLFPVYVAVLLWAGLWLRDVRVRALLRAQAN